MTWSCIVYITLILCDWNFTICGFVFLKFAVLSLPSISQRDNRLQTTKVRFFLITRYFSKRENKTQVEYTKHTVCNVTRLWNSLLLMGGWLCGKHYPFGAKAIWESKLCVMNATFLLLLLSAVSLDDQSAVSGHLEIMFHATRALCLLLWFGGCKESNPIILRWSWRAILEDFHKLWKFENKLQTQEVS